MCDKIVNMKVILCVLISLSVVLSATKFPMIKGKTLTNETITIPNAKSNQLLILGFDQTISHILGH